MQSEESAGENDSSHSDTWDSLQAQLGQLINLITFSHLPPAFKSKCYHEMVQMVQVAEVDNVLSGLPNFEVHGGIGNTASVTTLDPRAFFDQTESSSSPTGGNPSDTASIEAKARVEAEFTQMHKLLASRMNPDGAHNQANPANIQSGEQALNYDSNTDQALDPNGGDGADIPMETDDAQASPASNAPSGPTSGVQADVELPELTGAESSWADAAAPNAESGLFTAGLTIDTQLPLPGASSEDPVQLPPANPLQIGGTFPLSGEDSQWGLLLENPLGYGPQPVNFPQTTAVTQWPTQAGTSNFSIIPNPANLPTTQQLLNWNAWLAAAAASPTFPPPTATFQTTQAPGFLHPAYANLQLPIQGNNPFSLNVPPSALFSTSTVQSMTGPSSFPSDLSSLPSVVPAPFPSMTGHGSYTSVETQQLGTDLNQASRSTGDMEQSHAFIGAHRTNSGSGKTTASNPYPHSSQTRGSASNLKNIAATSSQTSVKSKSAPIAASQTTAMSAPVHTPANKASTGGNPRAVTYIPQPPDNVDSFPSLEITIDLKKDVTWDLVNNKEKRARRFPKPALGGGTARNKNTTKDPKAPFLKAYPGATDPFKQLYAIFQRADVEALMDLVARLDSLPDLDTLTNEQNEQLDAVAYICNEIMVSTDLIFTGGAFYPELAKALVNGLTLAAKKLARDLVTDHHHLHVVEIRKEVAQGIFNVYTVQPADFHVADLHRKLDQDIEKYITYGRLLPGVDSNRPTIELVSDQVRHTPDYLSSSEFAPPSYMHYYHNCASSFLTGQSNLMNLLDAQLCMQSITNWASDGTPVLADLELFEDYDPFTSGHSALTASAHTAYLNRIVSSNGRKVVLINTRQAGLDWFKEIVELYAFYCPRMAWHGFITHQSHASAVIMTAIERECFNARTVALPSTVNYTAVTNLHGFLPKPKPRSKQRSGSDSSKQPSDT